ncbi:conserved hypothetical protein [Vibrio chagasii]|nr:conserved hypothetical protein [Vibrio chagasii]
MELKQFISTSLRDIMDGISDAQSTIDRGTIVPQIDENWSTVETGLTSYQAIDFEVSVNAVEQEGSEAKLNVVAAIVGGHVKGDSSQSATHTAKLKFQIPVRVPIDGQ